MQTSPTMLGINTPEQDVTAAAEKVRKDELEKGLRDYLGDLRKLAHDHCGYGARRLSELSTDKPGDFASLRRQRIADLTYYCRFYSSAYAFTKKQELSK